MSRELFSHRACWQAIEFSGILAVLPFKEVTELKMGFIYSDLQKQVEHMEGVYHCSSCPMRS